MKTKFFVGISNFAPETRDNTTTMCAIDIKTQIVHRFDDYQRLSSFLAMHLKHDIDATEEVITFDLPPGLILMEGLEELNLGRKNLLIFCLKEAIHSHKRINRMLSKGRQQPQRCQAFAVAA